MKVLLQKIKNISNIIYRRFNSRGFKGILQSFRNKSIICNHLSPQPLTISDCYAFYKNRKEFSKTRVADLPSVSIIILTYNNLVINKICLHSIYCNTTYPNFEVIVVDNCSQDGSAAWLLEFSQSHKNLKVILNAENRGFAAANNQAAQIATSDFLLFLNNDTIVTRGWIERFIDHFQSDPSIGLIGPVTNSTGNEARVPVHYQSPAEMEEYASKRALVMAGQLFDIRMLAFYCVMVRKNQYEEIGKLDERFGVGMFEDDDLAVRYHQKGLRVVCAEDVFIHHFQGASFNKLENQKYTQLFEENRQKYEEKWNKKWEPYRLRHDPYNFDCQEHQKRI